MSLMKSIHATTAQGDIDMIIKITLAVEIYDNDSHVTSDIDELIVPVLLEAFVDNLRVEDFDFNEDSVSTTVGEGSREDIEA
jgi:hypothetical protein